MKKFMLSIAFSAVALTSCGGGGGSDYYDPLVTTSNFVNRLNEFDPQFYLHEVVKDPATDIDYFVFYDAGLNEYIALDIWRLQVEDWGADEAADAYLDGDLAGYYELVDPDTPAAVDAWYDSGMTEVFYEGIDTGYLYEDTEASERDMLFAAKMLQESAAKKQGEEIASAYGLSEEQGLRMATVVQNWKTLSESREMTEADADAFSEDLFGFNFNDVNEAMEKARDGDTAGADELIDQAAESVDTTPENIRSIMEDMLQE